jgi:von Willebrand factor type A domain
MKTVLSCLVVVASLSNSGRLAAQASCRTSVPVIALASAPTRGFAVNDLRATVKGKEITIKEIKPPPATRRFVFVLDRSGSMIGVRSRPDSPAPYDLDRLMKQDVEQALGDIPKNDSVAFLTFSGGDSTLSEFAIQAAARARLPAIMAWQPRKGMLKTPLWDNIEIALQMLGPHATGDVIVVLSDGGDNTSKLSMEKVQADLLKTGVPVLAILIADPSAPTPENRAGPGDLARLAAVTGGATALADGRLAGVFPLGTSLLQPNQLIPLLAHQYQLEIETPPIQKPEKWELKANSPPAGRRLNLLYPRYLLPCTEAH